MGIRCVIAPTVADQFAANCFQNGILAFTLEQTMIESLAAAIAADPANRRFVVDLQRCQVGLADGELVPFSVPARRREALFEGFDEIDLTSNIGRSRTTGIEIANYGPGCMQLTSK